MRSNISISVPWGSGVAVTTSSKQSTVIRGIVSGSSRNYSQFLDKYIPLPLEKVKVFRCMYNFSRLLRY